MKKNQLEDYCQFIRVINQRISEYFDSQKDYIFCKEGCSYCCKKGEYPCSELEFEFIKLGFATLDNNTKNKIAENIYKVKKEKENFTGKVFDYVCPFLIDDRCSIYNFRMVICRTFGVPYYTKKDGKTEYKIPFCVDYGLNYSNVYDKDTLKLSSELNSKHGLESEPLAFNSGVKFFREKFGEDIMHLDFGETKALIDWL